MKKVECTQSGQRVDLFLKDALGISRKKVKNLLDQGRVFLGDKKILMASWEVHAGDEFVVAEENEGLQIQTKSQRLDILYEDKHLIAVDKPAFISCEPSPQNIYTKSVVDLVNDYLARTTGQDKSYLGLMHRLDRETSGVMLFSKTKRANILSEQFKRHTIRKKYLAFVTGYVKSQNGRVDTGIIRDEKSEKKHRCIPTKKGRPIYTTLYRVVERYRTASLLELQLITGKTHQARLHMAHMKHPILGDKIYGKTMKGQPQLLHAHSIECVHPITKKELKVVAKEPKRFKNLRDRFQSAV